MQEQRHQGWQQAGLPGLLSPPLLCLSAASGQAYAAISRPSSPAASWICPALELEEEVGVVQEPWDEEHAAEEAAGLAMQEGTEVAAMGLLASVAAAEKVGHRHPVVNMEDGLARSQDDGTAAVYLAAVDT